MDDQTTERTEQEVARPTSSIADLSTPIYGLFILGILYTLYLAHQIVLPIILAVLTSLLLAPLVKRAYLRWRCPRVVSSLVLVLVVLAGILGLGAAVATPALEWAQKAPEGLSRLLVGDSEIMRQIDKVSRSAEQVEKSVEELSENKGTKPTTVVLQTDSWRSQLMAKARNGIAGLALALALTYFLLVSGDRLIRNFVKQLPRTQRKTVLRITHDSQHQIAQYLAVLGLSNTSVGVLTGLICWGIGLPDPAVWGLIAGLARFIPYLGNMLTIALLAIVSAISLDTLWMMALAPVSFIVLTTIVGFFLEPWIHGFRMAINPVVIFISIFFWGWLWGPVGVLLAVPLMTVIQVVLKQIPRLQPVYRVIAR
ncbi:AI-2E family transporter [Marinobacter daepoensis]|uniref:AI-2E family transporter n=1 Tax=Marinobacter daepoensis TaxID=262077 RepID=A0ABS3BJE7_9GAMM|nr:AI-2E family transporter [Marinobacter daepoensis]MBN7771628.1 AI-2E family transporter [Marinobacter daepoensis]MBY6034965.1 AI-2E family transporter [Marinobacter daepoensis]MBY6080927.1 AI-2E family transporter [Marinobacter daepoensis]